MKKDRSFEKLITVGALACMLLFGMFWYTYGTKRVDNVVINDKLVKTEADGQGRYMIFTSGGVYVNQDTIFHFKWSSSDLYGQIKVGAECDIESYGARLPFLSMYRNILKVECTNV